MNTGKLKALRESMGWNKAEAARRVGISAQSYGHYENGKREPDFAMMIQIADAFGVDVLSLDSDSMKPDDVKGKLYILECYDRKNLRWIPLYPSIDIAFHDDEGVRTRFVETRPCVIENEDEYKKTVFVKVTDDSMSPMLQEGDILRVVKADSAASGDIVVAKYNKTPFLRRFLRLKSGCTLESPNPDVINLRYPMNPGKPIRITPNGYLSTEQDSESDDLIERLIAVPTKSEIIIVGVVKEIVRLL